MFPEVTTPTECVAPYYLKGTSNPNVEHFGNEKRVTNEYVYSICEF